jgi:hypothetical protein
VLLAGTSWRVCTIRRRFLLAAAAAATAAPASLEFETKQNSPQERKGKEESSPMNILLIPSFKNIVTCLFSFYQ